MTKLIIMGVSIFLFFVNQKLSAQQLLTLEKNQCKRKFSYFDSVSVIDKRVDTNAALGRIKVNASKGFESLVSKSNIREELSNYYSQANRKGIGHSKGHLVIILYDFFAQEGLPGLGDETGSFRYSADYFISESEMKYRLLGSVDTTVLVSAFDVTNVLLKSIGLTT